MKTKREKRTAKQVFAGFIGGEGVRSVASSVICVVIGVIVGFIVLAVLALCSKTVPDSDIFKGIRIILGGPFASGTASNTLFNLGDMLLETAPLLMTGLSVAIAFKTGLFNIGAPGQYLIGTMCSLIVALSIPNDGSPFVTFLIWLLALVSGIAGGALWGAIPGIFKAVFNVNEVIVCIMTNWIAANLVSWVFSMTGKHYINYAETKTNLIRTTITNNIQTPRLGLGNLFKGSNIDISIFIAIAVAIVMYIVINKTVFGYELRACGFNSNAAKYAGMKGKRNIILSMVIAGGLAGCGAALWYLNGHNQFTWNTYSTLPATGFNGIPVALLASNNPLGVILSSVFLRYLDKGGFNLTGFTSFNEYVSDLIVALIIYFAGFSKFFRDILARKRKSPLEAVSVPAGSASGPQEILSCTDESKDEAANEGSNTGKE